MAVQLVEVTRESLGEVLRLSVRKDQKSLVAPNAVSISQAHFEENAWFRAIHDGDIAVGFLMMALREDGDDWDYLWRFMVDASQQKKGYGRQALELLVEQTRSRGKRAIVLSHGKDDGHAGPFYEKLGFQYTGAEEHGELVMRLDF